MLKNDKEERMEPKIGVYICHCGANIAGTVDVEQVIEFAKGLPSVAVARITNSCAQTRARN